MRTASANRPDSTSTRPISARRVVALVAATARGSPRAPGRAGRARPRGSGRASRCRARPPPPSAGARPRRRAGPRTPRRARLERRIAVERGREPGGRHAGASSASARGALLRRGRRHAATRGREAFVAAPRREQAARQRQPRRGDAGRVRERGESSGRRAAPARRGARRRRPTTRARSAGLDRARARSNSSAAGSYCDGSAREVVRHPQLPADALVAAQQALHARHAGDHAVEIARRARPRDRARARRAAARYRAATPAPAPSLSTSASSARIAAGSIW